MNFELRWLGFIPALIVFILLHMGLFKGDDATKIVCVAFLFWTYILVAISGLMWALGAF